MTIQHHPDENLLLAYATGAADEATRLILATHMTFCAPCRRAVGLMERIGGGLLETLPAAPLSEMALQATLARLDEPAAQPARLAPSRDGTPHVLRAYLGGDLSAVKWRRMGQRLAYKTLLRRGRVSARLLRGAPGTEIGAHTHGGLEYTLVLAGGFSDVTGRYGRGDLQVADGDLRHSPIADAGEACIILTVTTAPLKFESPVLNIARPLFGF